MVFLYDIQSLDLALEVGGQDVLSNGGANLVKSPEAAAVEFVIGGVDLSVVNGTEDIDQLPLPQTLEDVHPQSLGREDGDAEFLAHLSEEGFLGRLAVVDVSADGCVPLPWLDVFPFWALLQVELTCAVEHMQMHHGVQSL